MDKILRFPEFLDVPMAAGVAQSPRLLFEFLDGESRDPAFDVWR